MHGHHLWDTGAHRVIYMAAYAYIEEPIEPFKRLNTQGLYSTQHMLMRGHTYIYIYIWLYISIYSHIWPYMQLYMAIYTLKYVFWVSGNDVLGVWTSLHLPTPDANRTGGGLHLPSRDGPAKFYEVPTRGPYSMLIRVRGHIYIYII